MPKLLVGHYLQRHTFQFTLARKPLRSFHTAWVETCLNHLGGFTADLSRE
jgi:hypothetical protein